MNALTVADVAEKVGTSESIILAHIHAGRLVAVNIGLGSQRPRWRLTQEAVTNFLESRAAPRPEPRRRRKATVGVIEFF